MRFYFTNQSKGNLYSMTYYSAACKYVLIAFMVLTTSVLLAQDKKLAIEGKVALEVGSPSGAKVTVEKNGRGASTASVSAGGDFDLTLDFDADYTITISQDGFVPVKFRIVTNASADAKKDGLMPFNLPVFMAQKYPGAPDGSKVMATVKFDEVLYDFDFDKPDYKSISSQKKVVMAQKTSAMASNQANAEAEMKAKQEAIAKRYAEEEAARKKAYEEEERLRKEKEIQDKYDAAIGKADKAFGQSEWEFAKQFYQEAATLKPAEAYPKTKLTEIETRVAGEKKYTAAMEKGNNAMTAKDFALAKTAFTEALTVKPADPAAKAKLAEADAAIAEANKQKELDAKYTTQIAAADKLFVAKNWAGAKTAYADALKLKPNEEHPKSRIAEAEKMLADEEAKKAAEKQLNDQYNAAITKADKLFTEKKWTDAKAAYTEASTLKPAELTPKNKIKEIEGIEKAEADKAAKEKENQEKYDAAMAKGEGLFASQKLTDAKAAYTEAATLKPTEQAPKTKIAEIEKLIAAENQKLADEKALADKYNAALTKGSTALAAKKLTDAKAAYSEAAGLKPNEELPKTKLAEIDQLIAQDEAAKAAEKQLTDQYNAAMKKGDTEFGNKNFAAAKTAYGEAATLKPTEALPKSKLKEVEAAERAEADRIAKEKETNDKYAAAVAAGDAAFGSSDWLTAKTEYTKATQLKANEAHPKNRLTEIEGKLKNEADQKAAAAALDKKYSDALALGEKQLVAKKYNEAKMAFSDASTLKPTESLPKEKIAQIDQLLADQAEAAKLKAEQDAKLAAEEAARKKAEEDAKAAADAEAKRKAQEQADALAKKKAEEDAAKKKLAEEEAAKRAAELDAKQKADAEAARLAAEEKAKKDAEAAKKAEADAAAKKLAADEAARKKAEEDAARLAAEEAAKQKALADKEAADKKRAEDEAARIAAEDAAKQKALADKEAADKKRAEEEAARLAAEDAAAKKKALADKEAADKKRAEDEAARLAEEAAKQKALADKNAADKKRAEADAARLAAEEAQRQKEMAEAEARKKAESAQRQALDAQEQARLDAERKKQLEEALRLKEEQDRERKKAKAIGIVPKNDGPFVVIYKYTFSTEQVYGYINMGDGTGNRDVSETEYKSLLQKYKEYIRNIYN